MEVDLHPYLESRNFMPRIKKYRAGHQFIGYFAGQQNIASGKCH